MPHPSATGRRLVIAVAALLAAAALAITFAATDPTPAAASTSLSAEEQAHLDRLNAYRGERGLPRLAVDSRVQEQAREWAHAMARSGRLAHDPDLRGDCYAASSTCTGWAENVAMAGDHNRAFDALAASPGHARNMAMSSSDVPVFTGVAVVHAGGRTWVVQRFMRCRCGGNAAALVSVSRAQTAAFARALHRDFLGGDGSEASRDAVITPVLQGADRRAVIRNLAYSDAWLGAMVDGYYRTTLKRAPDEAGRRHWIGVLRGGASPAQVASHFFSSPEHYQLVGGTDGDWVHAMYRSLLGRSPERDGARHWVARMRAGESRASLALELFQSVESRRTRVVDLYNHLLERNPDNRGLHHWIGRLADGQDIRLAIDLAGSDEYLARSVARFG